MQGTAESCLCQSSGPGIITAPSDAVTPGKGSRRQSSSPQPVAPELFQGWAGAAWLVLCLLAQASPHPHAFSKSLELKGSIVEPWRWGGERSQSCDW